MQVSPVSRLAAARPQRDPSRQTLVAGLVLSLTPPLAAFHSDRGDLTDQLRAERRQDLEQRRVATQSDRQGLTQTLRERERLMRPGSHAFRQALRREQLLRTAAPAARAPAPSGREPGPTPPAEPAPAGSPPSRRSEPQPEPATHTVTRPQAALRRPGPDAAGDRPAAAAVERGSPPATAAQTSTGAAPSAPPARVAAALLNTRVFALAAGGSASQSQARGTGTALPARSEPAPAVDSPPRGRAPRAKIAVARTRSQAVETQAQQQQRIKRIVRVVRHSLRTGQTRTTLRLDPPALGKLRIDIALQDSAVHLRFEPAHKLAHRLLTRQADELAAALKAAGLDPQRIEIQPAPHTPPQSGHADGGAQHGGSAASGGHEHAARRPAVATVARDDGDTMFPENHVDAQIPETVLHKTMVNVWA